MTEKYKKFLDLNFYQIYPKSFYDANNDGVGDFNGITEKIPYLKDLGINAVWLSPFFVSPEDDSGYDISDYYDVSEKYGTLEDFKVMLKTFHNNGIKVIIDLVVNHTSTEHKWFKEAVKSKDNPYRDFYYWADKPLNDWKACFGGSAWEYNKEAGQYYLHSFAVSQADLNWENPKVIEEVKKIIDFWVDLGVDGFRCDVLDMISKDFKENRNGNGPRLHEFIHAIFGREKTKNIYTVGECWGVTEKSLCDLTKDERGELTTSFLCGNMTHDNGRFNPVPPRYEQMREYFTKYETLTQNNDLIFAPFFENHDQCRSVSRFCPDKNLRKEAAAFFATILYTLRGTPFILQGEEFGTPDAEYDSIEYFDDIETVNYYKAHKGTMPEDELMKLVNFDSRDNGRRPMMWTGGANGGFNKGAKPWLPIHSGYKTMNLEADINSGKSVFGYYKKMLELRNGTPALRYGIFNDETEHEREKEYFKYSRTYENEKYLIVINYDKTSSVSVPENAELVLGNYSFFNEAEDINNGVKTFKPFETAIYKIK